MRALNQSELSQTLPMTRFQKNTKKALTQLNCEAAPILLTRRGRSVAVLVDLDSYARLETALRLQETYLNRMRD